MPNKWILHEIGGCRLPAREGATLTKILISKGEYNKEDRLYLFGGLGRGLISALSYLQITPNGNTEQQFRIISSSSCRRRR